MKNILGVGGGGELHTPASHPSPTVDKETGIANKTLKKQKVSRTDTQAAPPITAKTRQEIAKSNPMLSTLISKIESFIDSIAFFIDLALEFVTSSISRAIGSSINEGMNRFDKLIRELNDATTPDELKQETAKKNKDKLMIALHSGNFFQIREARKNIPVPSANLNLTENEESILKSFKTQIGNKHCSDSDILDNLSPLRAEVLDQSMALDDNTKTVTPLHLSILNDRLEITKALIAKGVHLETGDREGKTALMLAVQKGDLALINTLMEAGANPNTQAANGETALILAAKLMTSGQNKKLGTQLFSYLVQYLRFSKDEHAFAQPIDVDKENKFRQEIDEFLAKYTRVD